MISNTSPFLACSRSVWTSLLLHLFLQKDRHPCTSIQYQKNLNFKAFLVQAFSFSLLLKKSMCFFFFLCIYFLTTLSLWVVLLSNCCVHQFVFLWSMFLILKQTSKCGSGQGKLSQVNSTSETCSCSLEHASECAFLWRGWILPWCHCPWRVALRGEGAPFTRTA